MTVLTAADVLREARRLLVARGWGPLGGRMSIYEAVALAALGRAFGEGGPLEDEAHWLAAVGGPCRFLEGLVQGRGYAGIAHWEMTDDRTQADVIEVFDLAIEAADWVMEPRGVAA